MKTQHPFLRLSVCLAVGGMVTVVIMCFFIGFGFHSPVGKYALYTALFLQLLSLGADHITQRKWETSSHSYTPSGRMLSFRRTFLLLWLLGALSLLLSLALILSGLEPSAPWVRRLCIPGIFLCPAGWWGVLVAGHRRRQAIQVLLSRKTAEPVE